MTNQTPYILIPAYEPNEVLIDLVQQLLQAGMTNIIVVNDGSGVAFQAVFAQLPATVILLNHEQNQGKGAALKTGFQYLQDKNLNVSVITVDADGQHAVQDVKALYDAMMVNPQQFVLGVRQFDPNIPWRSRFGNELTKKIFHWRYKYYLQDTQTGLRGISAPLQKQFLTIASNHYEFESECLIMAVQEKLPILQLPIQTIYIANNQSSHFNPILDSLKIYFVFFRYCIVAMLSFLIDFTLFAGMHFVTGNIFASLITARIFSGGFNFYQNKFKVYQCLNKEKLRQQIIEYIVLAVITLIVGYVLISGAVFYLHWNVLLAKIIVDGLLFVINFLIQKVIIFNKKIVNCDLP